MPTTDVNFDLLRSSRSSQISWALPLSEQDAHAQFVPPQSYLDWIHWIQEKRGHKHVLVLVRPTTTKQRHKHECTEEKDEDEDTQMNSSRQHSRALAAQTSTVRPLAVVPCPRRSWRRSGPTASVPPASSKTSRRRRKALCGRVSRRGCLCGSLGWYSLRTCIALLYSRIDAW